MVEKNIIEFLKKKDEELYEYYTKAPTDIQKMMKNIYNASFRFGLTNSQTIYMLEESLKPFKQDILMNAFM